MAGGKLTTAAELERYLHEHIPLSRHLGTRVLEATPAAVRLAAPLAPNLNHRRTGFGGSLSALAILAGWSWVWLALRDGGGDIRIVIQSNTMEYVAPAEADFEAVCRAPSAERWEHCRTMLRERGKGRIGLDADVTAASRLVATFHGRYVAVRSRPGDAAGR